MTEVKLIPIKVNDEIVGYESANVTASMESIGKLKEWQEWYVGQTGAIVDGKFIVYDYDVDGCAREL